MSWLRQNPVLAWLTLAAIGAGLVYWLRTRRRKAITTPQPSSTTAINSPEPRTPSPSLPPLPPPMIQPDADTAPDAPMPFLEALPDVPLPVIAVEDLLQSTHKQIVHTMASAHDDKTYAAAMKQLEQLGDEAQEDPEWLLTQASAHIQMGAFGKAAQCLHTIQTQHPHSHAAKDAVMLEMATEIEFGAPFTAAIKAQRDAAKARAKPSAVSRISSLLGRAKKPALFEPVQDTPARDEAPDHKASHSTPAPSQTPDIARPQSRPVTPTPASAQPLPQSEPPTPAPQVDALDSPAPSTPEPPTSAPPPPNAAPEDSAEATPPQPAKAQAPQAPSQMAESAPAAPSLDDIMATLDFDQLDATKDSSRFHTPLDLPVVEYTEDDANESLDDILGDLDDDWDIDWPEGWDDPAPTEDPSQPLVDLARPTESAITAPQEEPAPPQTNAVPASSNEDPPSAVSYEPVQPTQPAHAPAVIEPVEITAPPSVSLGTSVPLETSDEARPAERETPEEILASLGGERAEPSLVENFQSLEPTLGGLTLKVAMRLEYQLEEADRWREQGEYEQAGEVLRAIIDEAPDTRYAKDAEMRLIGDRLFFAAHTRSE